VPGIAAVNVAGAQDGRARPPTIAQKPTISALAAKPGTAAPGASGLDPEAAMKLNGLAARLNSLDYFQILNVEKTATPVEIKTAFHRWSRAYHPDRFYQLADKQLKQRVNEVYKRITEAYYILRDDGKRKAYLSDISGSERIQKLRFTEASELETKAAIRKEHDEQIGTHPKGRQFFQTGMTDFDAQRWAAAERNFKMALTFEPANPRYKEKLEEARQNLYQESKKAGDPFKIR
jgi:DnaJ-class molecular chaperone